jgi:integrase
LPGSGINKGSTGDGVFLIWCQFFLYCPELPTSGRILPKIRAAKYADGRRVWCVDWRQNGERKRRFFPVRAEAREFANRIAGELRAAAGIVGDAAPMELAQALLAWRENRKSPRRESGPKPFTWREWCLRYLGDLDCSDRHRKALSSTVAKVPWQTIPVASVSAERIEGWMRGKEEWSASTRRTYLAHLSEIFASAVKAGHVEANPCAKVTLPKAKASPVRVYAPGEVERLLALAWAQERRLVPGLAIGLFAGLRPQSELARLDWRDVRIEEGIIVVHSSKVRSASRRVVPIAPVLARWLLACGRERSGPVLCAGWEQARKRLCARSGFAWIADGMRHSFASYRLAELEDAGKVALELGHANTKMLFAHYRALVTRAEAEAFWAIEPPLGQEDIKFAAAG